MGRPAGTNSTRRPASGGAQPGPGTHLGLGTLPGPGANTAPARLRDPDAA